MELIGRDTTRARLGQSQRWHLVRIVVPAYPAFNIYSAIARKTSALGPICVATAASKMADWTVEVIDENNYRRPGPKDRSGRPDHGLFCELSKLS